MDKPPFSQMRTERIGGVIGLAVVPLLGVFVVSCLGVIGLTDPTFEASEPAVLGVTVGTFAFCSVMIGVLMVVQGGRRARQATLVDDLVEATGGHRPSVGPLVLPRMWCRAKGHDFEVVQYSVGHGAYAMGEVEDSARRMIFDALDVPNARIPHGKHWRLTIYGGLAPKWTFVVTAKGPRAIALTPVTGLHTVQSGDERFDGQVVVFSDKPEAAARLLADPERRETLRRLILCNGNYVNSVAWKPRKSAAQPGVVQKFVLHAAQTGDELALQLDTLVEVAGWVCDDAATT